MLSYSGSGLKGEAAGEEGHAEPYQRETAALGEVMPLGPDHIQAVDRAMFLQACAGSVVAARMIYMRVFGGTLAPAPEDGPPPTVKELERMMAALRRMTREETE
jgi:hypothetical protein